MRASEKKSQWYTNCTLALTLSIHTILGEVTALLDALLHILQTKVIVVNTELLMLNLQLSGTTTEEEIEN